LPWVPPETSTSILRSFLTAVQTDAGFPAVAEVEIRNPFNPATFRARALYYWDHAYAG